MSIILKGKVVADAIDTNTFAKVKVLKDKGINPKLAIIRTGDNASDIAYERIAVKKAEKLNINVKEIKLPLDISQDKFKKTMENINRDKEIHGVLMLRPLPKNLDEEKIRNLLTPEKDLDCISDRSLTGIFTDSKIGYPPCTAESCMAILEHYDIPIEGKRILVIGRSLVIGKPIAMMLLKKNGTVTISHSKTPYEEQIKLAKASDIIVTAVGKEKTFTAEMTEEYQTIIDVGINFDEKGNMCGDVDFEAVKDKVAAITSVPGGVGSVTTSILMANLVDSAERNHI